MSYAQAKLGEAALVLVKRWLTVGYTWSRLENLVQLCLAGGNTKAKCGLHAATMAISGIKRWLSVGNGCQHVG